MMANLVLAAIVVKSAVAAQMDYAKSTLGGTVTIQANMDSVREEQRAKIEAGEDKREMFGKMVRPQISVSTANEIASDASYVRDYSYELSVSANSNELETVESNSRMPGGMGGAGGFNPFGGSSSSEETALDGDVTISGINAYAYISGVQNESIEIKSGEYFDEDSENGVIISLDFAELNDLEVGGTITLKNVYTEEAVELKVLGIYDSSEQMANANIIYANTETAAKFLSGDDYNDGDYNVSNVNFYMVNSETAEEFVTKINEKYPELAENKLKVAVDTSEYDAMAGSIESVGSFATMILWIVMIAAVIIVTLIVTINVKDRNYEMGVLLSLGATKKNIIWQIALELVIVGSFGFVLASLTGSFFAKALGNSILESQMQSARVQEEKSFGRPGAQVGGRNGGMPNMPNMPEMPDGASMKQKMFAQKEETVELDINAGVTDYLLLFVAGYLVIILALILPSVNILRYQPKQILAGKE